MILAAARALVAEHPDRARPRTGWPCCTFVGHACLRAGGIEPPPGWWAEMCVYDAAEPWSPMAAARRLVEVATGMEPDAPGRLVQPYATPETPETWDMEDAYRVLAGLVPGRWHVVQRWTHLQPDGTVTGQTDGGHTVLLQYLGDGMGRILESSEARGVRLCGVPWHEGEPPDVAIDLRPWLLQCKAGVGAVPLWEGA